MRQIDLKGAYEVLSLPETASLEEVKNSYKKLALQFHPDKNSSPDATERFQEIGTAYNWVVKHIENPGFGEDHFWDGDDDDEEMDIDFFMFLFTRVFAGAQARRSGQGSGPPPYASTPNGSFADSEERMRKVEEAERAAFFARRREESLEIQLEAQKKEMERLKEHEKEQARLAAEREIRKKQKKDGRAKTRQEQRETVKKTKRAGQRKRSEAFKLARSGDAERVKKGIWEQNIDAAGQECLTGMENDPVFLEACKGVDYDIKETFLHIFVRIGDLDMVQWLIDHNAEPEERDSHHRTPFHVALQRGYMTIISFFIQTFPPQLEDSFPIFVSPKSASNLSPEYSLLRLAMDSLSLPVVRTIIDNRLFENSELKEAWNYIIGEGLDGPGRGYGDEQEGHADISSKEKLKRSWASIRDLLKKQGSFEVPTPQPILPIPVQSPSRTAESSVHPEGLVDSPEKEAEPPLQKKKRARQPKKKPTKVEASQDITPLDESSAHKAIPSKAQPEIHSLNGLGYATLTKPAERSSSRSEIKVKAQGDSVIDAQKARKAENSHPSPTSGYPSSPEATTRHKHLPHYSHSAAQTHQPTRAQPRHRNYNKHPSFIFSDRFAEARADANNIDANPGSGAHILTAKGTNAGTVKTQAKGGITNTGTCAETAIISTHIPVPFNTARGIGSSRPGGGDGSRKGFRGRTVFRGEARRGRGAHSSHNGNSTGAERAAGQYGRDGSVDANGQSGGSESRTGNAEGARGRGYGGRGGRGRGEERGRGGPTRGRAA